MANKKLKRGGKREGSGRKKRSGTTVIRVPLILKDDIKKMVLDLRNEEGKIKTVHPMPKYTHTVTLKIPTGEEADKELTKMFEHVTVTKVSKRKRTIKFEGLIDSENDNR